MKPDEKVARRRQQREIFAGSREEQRARFLDKGPEELRAARGQLLDLRERAVQTITRKNVAAHRLRHLQPNPGTTPEQLSEAEADLAASESRLAELKVEMAAFQEDYHRQSRDIEVRRFPPAKRERALEIVIERDQRIEELVATYRETGIGVHVDRTTEICEASKGKLRELHEE